MCGFTGFLTQNCKSSSEELCNTINRMTDQLVHRGPDDRGVWVDCEAGIALGHRRLSIVDLSEEGHQPMVSSNGRFVLVYNGEVYNFLPLMKELQQKGYSFRGHSDTEVILASIHEWGVEEAVKRFVGMFAFALWDRQDNKLHLCRDRMGEKPLYYGWIGKTFFFSSELKAIRAHPDFRKEIDRDSLTLFMRHNYIPAPYSIYKNIYKLIPGTILSMDMNRTSPYEALNPVAYWSLRSVSEKGMELRFEQSEAEAIDRLDQLLRDSVSQKMIADVPIGAFLSGGIDSTTIVALMQAQSSLPVKTFTIGFYEEGYNEAKHARAVADYLSTDHTELYVTAEQAMDVIPKLPSLYDEPFSDSSQIPTFLVSQLARKHVTVSLSGDGGDELFGGYNRYFLGKSIWDKVGSFPTALRQKMADCLTLLPPQKWDKLFGHLTPVLPNKFAQRLPGDKMHKIAGILAVENPEEMYHRLVSHWNNPASLVLNSKEPLTILTDRDKWAQLPDFVQRMMYLDTLTYLPDDILVKVDRASMGVSLESRVPMLDHRVVEFAWTLPLHMKIREAKGKWLLRQVLYKYVPKELIERPKMGFGVPIDQWLRGPLREWAESLLGEHRLTEEGYFNVNEVRIKWNEHLSGNRNWQYHLWDVLCFQAWLEENKHYK